MTHPLKPCPFCGTDKINASHHDAVYCMNINCGAAIEANVDDHYNRTPDQLRDLMHRSWNTRSAEEAIEAMAKALEMLNDSTGCVMIKNTSLRDIWPGIYEDVDAAIALAKPYRKKPL